MLWIIFQDIGLHLHFLLKDSRRLSEQLQGALKDNEDLQEALKNAVVEHKQLEEELQVCYILCIGFTLMLWLSLVTRLFAPVAK